MAPLVRINDEVFLYYERLRRLREHVLSCPTEPLSLSKAAAIAGLERTAFSKFFHRKVGIRFREWHQDLRVHRAIALLESTDASITQTAFEAGFRSLRSFERAFLANTGVTACAFKKAVAPLCAPSGEQLPRDVAQQATRVARLNEDPVK